MVTSVFNSLNAVSGLRRVRSFDSRSPGFEPLGGSKMPDGTVVPLGSRKQPDYMRTGFGEGTVSPPAMVIRTLDKGLEAGRKVVPTTAELYADMQERRAADRARLRSAGESRDIAQTTPVDYASQARDFVSTVNRAAALAQSRIGGQQEPGTESGARVQVNGQSLPYLSAQGTTSGTLNVEV